MKIKPLKKWLILISAIMIFAVMTGCACNTGGGGVNITQSPMPTQMMAPTVTPLVSPGATGEIDTLLSPMPTVTTSATTMPVDTVDQGKKASDDIMAQVEMLSEIDSARVAVMNDSAVVAVSFAAAYQGNMTDRITSMVEEKVKGVASGVTNIAVTADPALYKKTEDIVEMYNGDKTVDDIKTEIDKLIDEIKK